MGDFKDILCKFWPSLNSQFTTELYLFFFAIRAISVEKFEIFIIWDFMSCKWQKAQLKLAQIKMVNINEILKDRI